MIYEVNPVRAAFSLIGIFLLTAFHWFLLHAEFLAVILMLVYVGAVMVLFLFVVMMIQTQRTASLSLRMLSIKIGISTLCLGFVLNFICSMIAKELPAQSVITAPLSLHVLARALFTNYLIAFELCGIVLLVAMIAAVVLTLRGPQQRSAQNIAQQPGVKKKDRLSLIKGMSD
jgi:NADH-quinone oxidoreductase subunit J